MKCLICCITAALVLAGCANTPPSPSGQWYLVNPIITQPVVKMADTPTAKESVTPEASN